MVEDKKDEERCAGILFPWTGDGLGIDSERVSGPDSKQ
jgi:hypothetical protein